MSTAVSRSSENITHLACYTMGIPGKGKSKTKARVKIVDPSNVHEFF